MSSSPAAQSSNVSPSFRSKKPVIPKVWKRPHSTIYGKNVEFGTSLYSDKIGELNGRKFNSELPWSVRNSGGSSSSVGGPMNNNQGYLSYKMLNGGSGCFSRDSKQVEPGDVISNCGSLMASRLNYQSGAHLQCNNYQTLLEMTNPSRYSAKAKDKRLNSMSNQLIRMDFHDLYENEFNNEIVNLKNKSLLNNDPLLMRKNFDNFLDFDYELGLFLPPPNSTSSHHHHHHHHHHSDHQHHHQLPSTSQRCPDSGSRLVYISGGGGGSSSSSYSPLMLNDSSSRSPFNHQDGESATDFNNTNSVVPFKPFKSPHLTATKLLNNKQHHCNLVSSPYGQSADGRKLSLGSINPQSYRPSLPQKTTTAHASDGEEIDLYDRSSPFYTDRWAGRTIRHFDSDLYSNANLFKSMIL